MVIKNRGLWMCDAFLSQEFNTKIFDFTIDNQHRFVQSGILDKGNQSYSEERISLTLYELDEIKALFIDEIERRIPVIFDSLGIPACDERVYDVQISAMGNRGQFARHIDTVQHENWPEQRVITVVYYFNKVPKLYSGGELRLEPIPFLGVGLNSIEIEPINNRMAAFPSFTPHEVLPVRLQNDVFSSYRFNLVCLICKKR